MYEMLPPNDHPTAPKRPNCATRRCQSARPERSATAIPASAPGIIAPNSCPKLPRIPQPRESDRATSVTNDQRLRRSVVCSIARASAHLVRSLFHRREEAGREALHSAEVGADLIFGRAAGAEGRLRLVTDRED